MEIRQTKIFALVCLILCLTANFIQAQDKLTINQLKADFSLFKQALQEAHPGLYRYMAKTDFDSLFEATEKRIDHEMTQQEFYWLLLPLVSQIKCGHTKFHPDSNWSTNFFFNTEKVFPWQLHFDGQKAFVTGSYTGNSNVPAGSEVISIQGEQVREIITKMLPAFFSDGNNTTFKYLEMDHYFSAVYANLFDGPDTFAVVCRNGEKISTFRLPAVSHAVVEQFEKQQEDTRAKEPPYQLEFKNGQTALITISSFWMESDTLSFKKFLKKSFRILHKKQPQNLIIDLRNNEGGEDRRGAMLLSYLMNRDFGYYDQLVVNTRKKFSFANEAHLPKFYGIIRHLISKEKDGTFRWNHCKNLKVQKPQRNHFNGNVYVLINGASFSVTAEFAAVAHYLKRATFIGEETGGGYYGNNSGTFAIVTLPNSRLNVGIPLVAYYTKVSGYVHPDHGVIPDYEVKPSVSDLLTGNDPVLNFTLELIRKQEN